MSFQAPSSARRKTAALSFSLILGTTLPLTAFAQDNGNTKSSKSKNTVPRLGTVSVTAKRFAQARNSLSPSTGSSQYVFDSKALKALPQGENTPLNQVLLQAPGVVSDSLGQLHVRGDHADLQYRINDVILPEGISGFGQVLSPRFASGIKLITGALPAQFGERTAGIIDITTKQNINGGDIGVYGGSRATIEPGFDYGATSKTGTTAFLSGSYLHSNFGTEPPTPAYNPIHGGTEQGRGFGFFAFNLSSTLRLSLMAGTSYNRFDIPNTPGLAPDPAFVAAAGGAPAPASANLDEQQFERNDFGILALQGLLPNDGSWQIAAFNRVSSVTFEPDPAGGDLLYNGVAARIKRKATTYGLQGDASIPLGEYHTLRAGFVATTEDDRSDNTTTIFPTDAGGNPNGPPQTIVDNNPKNGNSLEAIYVQDEWDLSDSVTLNYGLRFDQLNAYVSGNQLSPRIGMVWYIDPKTTLHAGYARYFTPPPNELVASSSIQKFADTTNAPEVTTNNTVKPERDDYFDLGVTHQFTDAYNVGLDGYYKYAHDLLDEGQFGQALIYTPFNYAQGHVYGIELTNAFHRGNWNTYLNISRSLAKATRVESGEFNFGQDELDYIQSHSVFLDHTQLWTASAGTSYKWRNTTYSLDGIYQDGLRNGFANTGKETPYVVLNAAVVHRFVLGAAGPLDVRLAVVNLLDRAYQIHDGTGIGVGAAQYGERRGVFLGLSKSI